MFFAGRWEGPMVGVTGGHWTPGTGWQGGPKPLPLQDPTQKLKGQGQEGGDGLGGVGGSAWMLQLQVRKGVRSRDSALGHPWVQGSLPIAEAHPCLPKRARQRTSQN